MPSLRQHLARVGPPVSLERALRTFLKALRAQERRGGSAGVHRRRATLDRALARELVDPPAELLDRLKLGLRDLVHAGLEPAEQDALVVELDALLLRLAGRTAAGPVQVVVEGWPPGLSPEQRAALLGCTEEELTGLPTARAAALCSALDGRCLAGSTLAVQARLPPGVHLPAVPRDARDRSQRGSRRWLPHLDAQGRWSASPLEMARAQARDLAGSPTVIDAFCGCGGNALAFARAGLHVVAIEREPARAELARANARDLGVELELLQGDARELLPALLDAHPGAALFLDPPWGGPGARRELPITWDVLVALPQPLLARAGRLLLKAPPSLDPRSLPPRWRWTWRFELSPAGADGRAVVLALSALGDLLV